jgi:hypothetical protein
MLEGRWRDIIVLNVHGMNDMKDSFYEELERVFDTFPKYHLKILLADFNAEAEG